MRTRFFPSTGRVVIRLLAISLLHFLIATSFAMLAYGTDFDQISSRSGLSRVAAAISDVLWHPHDVIIRALPNATLIRPGVIPAVLVSASLLWGCAAIAASALLAVVRARRPDDDRPRT